MKLEAFVRDKSRGNPETLRRYLKEIHRFQGWLGSRTLSLEAVHEYEDWLADNYAQNSRIVMAAAVNLFFAWKGVDYRVRTPPKEIATNPRLVKDAEYRAILARIADPAERLIVRLLHDSFWRPSDLVTLRVSDIAEVDGVTLLRKVMKKAKVVASAIVETETAAELRAHIAGAGKTDLIFEIRVGTPRHRTWPNHVLAKHGAGEISPRVFRRTGATSWDDDMKGLMVQGGWKDPKTILLHYRQNELERQLKSFERAVGRATDHSEDDVPGYG